MNPTAPAQLRVSKDPLGYWLGEDFREGFPDDPSLPTGARRRIAAWARRYTPEQFTEAHQAALDAPMDAQPSAAQSQAQELGSFESGAWWRLLSEQQRQLVKEPWRRPALKDRDYPLTIGQLQALTGVDHASLRYWNKVGLLPARRTSGGQRRFYAAAAARAFALKELGPTGITLLREIRASSTRASALLAGVSALLHEQALAGGPLVIAHSGLLERTAEDLDSVSVAFAQALEPAG